MMESAEFWKKHNYEVFLTEDQSPTLRWLGSETQETMHHRGGAYSETQLIYGNPLRDVLSRGGLSAVSVGLGLGYNEILVASEALRAGVLPMDFSLLSFESDPFLVSHFSDWLQEESAELIYDKVAGFFSEIEIPAVKAWLRKAQASGSWLMSGALEPGLQVARAYECIFYDAFSSKTSPHLWQEDFLNEFFRKACAPHCQVSTYACTGALKRALKTNGFEVIVREGFQGKRNSTLGIRTS
jgi:tRNA U34 5-methylaminomethyl-2-thiouridine-forming methyltransferase MnmC